MAIENEAAVNAIVSAIAGAFNNDIDKFQAFLVRASLETDLKEIESAIRKAQDAKGIEVDAANAIILDLQSQMTALMAEIDALI